MPNEAEIDAAYNEYLATGGELAVDDDYTALMRERDDLLAKRAEQPEAFTVCDLAALASLEELLGMTVFE